MALLGFTACTNEVQKDIDEIRSIRTTVEQCADGVAAIDSVQFMKMYEDVKVERDFMNINNRDSLGREEAIFLANYFRYMKKRMARILKGRQQMEADLRTTADQLGDLAVSIEQKDLAEDEWRAYLSKEMKHVERDTTLGFEMIRDYAGISERYTNEHQQVVDYVNVHRENAKKANEPID